MLLTVNRFGSTNISLRRFARGGRGWRLSAGGGYESGIQCETLARQGGRRYEVNPPLYGVLAHIRWRSGPPEARFPSPISAFPERPLPHPTSTSRRRLPPKRFSVSVACACSPSSTPALWLRSKVLPVALPREPARSSSPDRPLPMKPLPLSRTCERRATTPLPALPRMTFCSMTRRESTA